MPKIEKGNSFLEYQDALNSEMEKCVELRQIFVEEGERRKGVGTQLLKELIKIAQGRKIITYSSTDPETEVFGKWLVAMGFKKTGAQNSTGDEWELEPKEFQKDISKSKKSPILKRKYGKKKGKK